MRTQSNRETQLTVELTFRHSDLTPFWYGWDGRAFLCFLDRDPENDMYHLRHVYCGQVDIFGVLGPWAVEQIEDACLAHYTDQEPKMQSKSSSPKMQSNVKDPKVDNWGPVAEGGV